MRRLNITLISRDNGVGLSTDMGLLEGVFTAAGHSVSRVSWNARSMPRADVGIFVELFARQLMPYASYTVGLFNLEWFPATWLPYLRSVRQLWAKSEEAHQMFTDRRLRSVMTGFTARDLLDESVARTLSCVHLRGHSSLKGTEAVLTAWERHHADLPPLTIISDVAIPYLPPGVSVLPTLPHADLVRQMNTHAIHVCPSRSEGWGHYIAEALSVRAVVVTTDASPMHEHVHPDWGFRVPAHDGPRHHLAVQHHVDPDALAAAVHEAAALTEQRREQMGLKARLHWAHRNEYFRATSLESLHTMIGVR